MQHDLYKTGDPDAPVSIRDRNNQVVLKMCRNCGRAEAGLAAQPDCPYSAPSTAAPASYMEMVAKQMLVESASQASESGSDKDWRQGYDAALVGLLQRVGIDAQYQPATYKFIDITDTKDDDV